VFIVEGSGQARGTYVLSQERKRDGERIWDAVDSQGNRFIQEIVTRAVRFTPVEFGEWQYPWKNADDANAVMKIARFKYFAPADWVIAASVPD